MLPGLLLRDALLTLHLLVDTTLYDATEPRQEGRVADCCAILQERPQLHATDKARKEASEVKVHKFQDATIKHPRHYDAHNDKHGLEYCAPRLATLEPPPLPRAACLDIRGSDTREEVDKDKGYGREDKWRDGADKRSKRGEDAGKFDVFGPREAVSADPLNLN